jgi:iron-only hydrogenase group A
MAKFNIKINGKTCSAETGQNVLIVAEKNGIAIPSFCHHCDFPPKANCRVCVVEVKGQKRLQTSCSTFAVPGMEVFTDSDRVKKARNTNIELIFAEHIEKCATCVWRFECKLLHYAEKYKLVINRFTDRKKQKKIHRFANAVEIDGSQCIDCRNCVDACAMQKINFLDIKGKGENQEIVPSRDKDKQCILCGQCAVHCPVSSAQEQSQWEAVEKEIQNPNRIVVAQFAPSIRVSIGEDFGMPHGSVVTGKIVTALRELGFSNVFDVNFGADITTMVEAEELVERLTKGGTMPMMTSCCPGWVNFVEFYYPELIPHFTTARSPHIHLGGVIKTYWADKMKIDPKKIVVVSIMPCTAKKFEAHREEMQINGHFPVDYVLTNREFSFLMKKNKIDFPKLKNSQADNPLGEYSGAAAIYGASGGVMESALRTGHFLACGSKTTGACRPKIEFKAARGMEGVKDAVVDVGGTKLHIAVVNGIGNIGPVINNLKDFDYIEVMACPGGCIGGGGQPLPTNDEVRKKRIAALYKHDKNMKVRKAHENEGVKKALAWLKKKGHHYEHGVLHTSYKKRTRF